MTSKLFDRMDPTPNMIFPPASDYLSVGQHLRRFFGRFLFMVLRHDAKTYFQERPGAD